MKHEAIATMWRGRMAACEASGLPVTEYCRQNGVQKSGYYYWKRRLARRDNNVAVLVPANTPTADWLCLEPNAPVVVCRQQTLTIKVCGAQIEVGADFNPALLRSVVQALGTQSC